VASDQKWNQYFLDQQNITPDNKAESEVTTTKSTVKPHKVLYV